MSIHSFIFVLFCSIYLISCRNNKSQNYHTKIPQMDQTSFNTNKLNQGIEELKNGSQPYHSVSPVVYIYKTKKDYSHLVPITMNADRTRILSYPAPSDLIRNGQLTLPTALDKGYWLDNRGITPNVVFLTYTYEEYSKMPTAPSKEDMLKHIEDKYPLVNIINCGKRADYKDLVTELNQYIHDQNLK